MKGWAVRGCECGPDRELAWLLLLDGTMMEGRPLGWVEERVVALIFALMAIVVPPRLAVPVPPAPGPTGQGAQVVTADPQRHEATLDGEVRSPRVWCEPGIHADAGPLLAAVEGCVIGVGRAFAGQLRVRVNAVAVAMGALPALVLWLVGLGVALVLPRMSVAVSTWAMGGLWTIALLAKSHRAWQQGDLAHALLWMIAVAAMCWLVVHAGYLANRWAQETVLHAGRGPKTQPLDSQRALLDQIGALIDNSDRRLPLVISLRGQRGAGKSTIVHLLRERLRESSKRHAVTYFDAWEHQSEPNLELAMFSQIARELTVLWPTGWLRRPLLRLLPYQLLRSLALDLDLQMIRTRIDSRTGYPPSIWWRRKLMALVGGLGSKRRLIVIVDEIDRCEPVAAQTLLTLIPRFLALPGVVVIVPTVKEATDFKVFNPMAVELCDLESSMQAMIATRSQADGELLAALEDARSWPAPVVDGSPDGGARTPVDPYRRTMRVAVRRAMIGAFLRQATAERDSLTYLFEEKFFSTIPLHIPPVTDADVGEMFKTFATVKSALSHYKLGAASLELLRQYAMEQWREALKVHPEPRFSLRHLHGTMTELLLEFLNRSRGVNVREKPFNMTAEEASDIEFRVAALAVWFAIGRVVRGVIYHE